jgi:hypothetical protein
MVRPDGWTTRINTDNDVEWIPPHHLDTGQTRINNYHRPERLRPPPDDEAAERGVAEEPAGEEWFDDEQLIGPPDDEPLQDNPHEPGGPEPNAA